MISESHYERHLRRCRTSGSDEPKSLYTPAATAETENPDGGGSYGPPRADHGRTNWKKLAVAGFVIFLLIGSLVGLFII